MNAATKARKPAKAAPGRPKPNGAGPAPRPTIYGYARVSTENQDVEPQIKQLKAAGAQTVFREVASGAKSDRKGLRTARPGERDEAPEK